MLLIPAMRAGETLEIRAKIVQIDAGHSQDQQIFSSWNQELSQISIRAPIRRKPPSAAQGTRRVLFFSCGIDSFYSLLRRQGKQIIYYIIKLIKNKNKNKIILKKFIKKNKKKKINIIKLIKNIIKKNYK